MIRRSGRSWWQVRYCDGKVRSEWETLQGVTLFLPIGSNSSSRWEDIAKRKMRGLYLLCPDGKAGALESNGDYQFFQLKTGSLILGMGSTCRAHIIGKVDSDNGDCTCYVWDYQTKRLERFTDNVMNMKYQNIGALSLGVTGLR